MSRSVTLNQIAEEFLTLTNPTYEECAKGIEELDRIVISVHSSIADRSRTYLTPMVYAFWERFFTVSFMEFFNSLSKTNLPTTDFNEALIKVHVVKAIKRACERTPSKSLVMTDIAGQCSHFDLRNFLSQQISMIDGPISFGDAEELVEPSSNVGFNVFESHVKKIGLQLDRIKSYFDTSPEHLHPSLKKLVAKRNDIAHGSSISDTSKTDWDQQKDFVLKLINSLQLELYEYLRDESRLLISTPPACSTALTSPVASP